jgi:hypothetical protein
MTDISKLSTIPSVTPEMQIPVWDNKNRQPRRASLQQVTDMATAGAAASAAEAAASAAEAAASIPTVNRDDYDDLRSYAGAATTAFVKASGIAGTFVRDATVTVDNGGTEIVGVHGWKRVFTGAVSVAWFGALGDDSTDDASAIQAAVNSIASYGDVNNAFSLQPSNVLRFEPGRTYIVSREIACKFRNYLTIDFTGATLKWNGADDGRMFDCMGCNYLRVVGDLVNGNAKLGTFLRVSGGNVAGIGSKNNVTGARFKDFLLKSMFAAGTKPWISTINDVPSYGDFSLDDAVFENVWFSSIGYAGVELGSSEIRFDRCEFVSVTRGVIYRTGALARFNQTIWTGVRWPHYVVQNASVGEISNIDCYAESVNAAGPLEGSLLFCETGGASTAVKSFSIRGGNYSQGAAANVTSTSDMISCGDARVSVYIDGPRWQTSRHGRINLGTNGRAFIRKSTLSSSFVDFMPEIVGPVFYERIERAGAFQMSAPSVDSVTLTVDAASTDDYGALTFTTVDKAMALIDQLGATQTVIDIKSAQTLSTRRYLAGDLRITSSNGSTLTFNEEIRVRAGGSLTIDTMTVVCGTAARCAINRGGRVFANTLTVNNGAGKYLVRHEHGTTVCNAFTLQAGRMVDASYTAGGGTIEINGSNTYTSGEFVVFKGDSPIEVEVAGTAAPASGNWDVGIKMIDPSPAAAGFLGSICTTAGTPGTWKTFGAVSA